jgi:hypothetical protein
MRATRRAGSAAGRGVTGLMLYAVGDIHGRLDKLDALLAMLPLQPGD